MTRHILKKAFVLATPQVQTADVDTPGNLSCSTGIIRPKASDEGGNLTPSFTFHVQVVEKKYTAAVTAALTGLWVQTPS